MAFSVGQTVGDYQIIEILGAGGMGSVYKVRHLISDRLEAMKVVLPELTENAELADRFMREIKVQARLSHPNIAALHNAFRLGNELLMVIELIEGNTLYTFLREGVIEPVVALDMTVQVLNALAYAHLQGVVHRDIKPANIMVNSSGVLKLMDFGIARSLTEEKQLTRTGAALGSVYYMSPEQVQGNVVDARSDLYSVGVLLYEMATGVRPVVGESSWAVMNGHLSSIPRSPSFVNPRVPEALSLAILKAIEKDPQHRFQSAEAFSESLLAVRARIAASAGPGFAPARGMADLLRTATIPHAPPAHSATPPPPTPSAATPSSGSGQTPMVRFDPERLEKLTRELASFVGPMAKLLVNRAAKKAQTWRQLYDALAAEVPEGSERKQFLAKCP